MESTNVTSTPNSSPLTSGPSLKPPSLTDTFGAIYIGTCIALTLYGLTVHQTYRYFRLYPEDSRYLKSLVFSIFLAETAHTIMPVHLCYYHLVANYFNPAALLDDTWSLRFLSPVSAVAMVVCQSFYALRAYRIDSRYRILVYIAVLFLFIETGFLIALTYEAFKGQRLEDLVNLTWIVSAIYGIAVAVDCIVTGILIAYLLRSRTGFKSTDSLVQTLVVYTINTGLITSIFGVLTFVFALVISGNLIYFAVGIVATKLYANSVLALLNTRRFLSNQAIDGFDTHSLVFNNSMGCTDCTTIERGAVHEVAISLPIAADPEITVGDSDRGNELHAQESEETESSKEKTAYNIPV